jgi:hypothetical protein
VSPSARIAAVVIGPNLLVIQYRRNRPGMGQTVPRMSQTVPRMR